MTRQLSTPLCVKGNGAHFSRQKTLPSHIRQPPPLHVQLVDALLDGRFGTNPRSMVLVMECFEVMAAKYPRAFLHLITHMPLDGAPEVIQEIDCNDVMLPHMLVDGSSSRSPRGLWKAKIAQYRISRQVGWGLIQ